MQTGPSPDECRRFFYERGDVSLGIVPQLLLDETTSDTWAYFWYAARIADDEIESGKATAQDYQRRLKLAGGNTPAEKCLAAFFETLPSHVDAGEVRAELDDALAALEHEESFTRPPTMQAYANVVQRKATPALHVLNRLLLPGEDAQSVQRFSNLLALSIQLGDDLRDRSRDAERGQNRITKEEIEAADREFPDEGDVVSVAVVPWREAASKWLAVTALERAERFNDPVHRQSARLEALLWIRAIDLGHLRDQRHPMRWPAPLGDLLGTSPPSRARMAAARRVVHNEPDILGGPRTWDSRHRLEELQRIKATLPEFYDALELAARVQ